MQPPAVPTLGRGLKLKRATIGELNLHLQCHSNMWHIPWTPCQALPGQPRVQKHELRMLLQKLWPNSMLPGMQLNRLHSRAAAQLGKLRLMFVAQNHAVCDDVADHGGSPTAIESDLGMSGTSCGSSNPGFNAVADASPRGSPRHRHLRAGRSGLRHRVHFRQNSSDSPRTIPDIGDIGEMPDPKGRPNAHESVPPGAPLVPRNPHDELCNISPGSELPVTRSREDTDNSTISEASLDWAHAHTCHPPLRTLTEIHAGSVTNANCPSSLASLERIAPRGTTRDSDALSEQENMPNPPPSDSSKGGSSIKWTPDDRRLLQKARARRQSQRTQALAPVSSRRIYPQAEVQQASGNKNCCGSDKDLPLQLGMSEPVEGDMSRTAHTPNPLKMRSLWNQIGKASGEVHRLNTVCGGERRRKPGMLVGKCLGRASQETQPSTLRLLQREPLGWPKLSVRRSGVLYGNSTGGAQRLRSAPSILKALLHVMWLPSTASSVHQ
eukprot:jgi/Botrbrau1/14937/Bobra.0018s0041.1